MTTPGDVGDQSSCSEPVLSVIGRFIAETRIEIDDATRTMIRDALIDLLGCIVVGSGEEVAVKARSAMGHRSGPSVVYGAGQTLAPEAAALANAVAGHAIDFDDWEIPGNTHPSVVIIPALLASAQNRVISGRAFAEAYVVGFEIIAQLGLGLNFDHYDAGWHSTATLGTLGAAAATARLLNLNHEQASHAVGIAVSRAGGLTAQFGSDTKPLQAGFAAETGVTATTFAAAGLTARPTALEGRGGYNALTAHGDDRRLAERFTSLGESLSLTTHGLVFKPYPSCGYTHRIIDAALALQSRGIDPAGIQEIDIALPDFHAAILPFRTPTSVREARFSLPFCAALALTHGRVTAADFSEQMWRSSPIADLMKKTTVSPFVPANPQLNYDPLQPDRVTIRFADGSSVAEAVQYPRGAPQLPMSSSEILEKFCENVGRARNDNAVAALMNWPDTPNIVTHLNPWR